jgi:hypothetical protein
VAARREERKSLLDLLRDLAAVATQKCSKASVESELGTVAPDEI